jgi:hypothetical protein
MSAGWPYSDTGMMARVRRRDPLFDQGGIDVAGDGIDVDEHRRRPEQHDRLGGGDEGERGRDHFVAVSHAQRHQGDHQRLGARGHGDAVARARVLGQARLEFADFGTHDVLAMVEDCLDAAVDQVTRCLVLGLEVDEFHDGRLGWVQS